MGRGAKSVNDLLPPHERVFGITSYERARARSRSVSFTHTAPGRGTFLSTFLSPKGSNKLNDHHRYTRTHARTRSRARQRAVAQLVFDDATGARTAQTRMSGTAWRRQQSSSKRLTVFPATPSPSCSTMGPFACAFAVRADAMVRLSAGVPRRPADAFLHPCGVCRSPFWEDDHVDPGLASLWEYFTKQLLQEARKKAMERDDSGGSVGLSTIGDMVGGAGGGKNLNTAEVSLQKGQEHMEKKEFAQAIECFKAASNWCAPQSLSRHLLLPSAARPSGFFVRCCRHSKAWCTSTMLCTMPLMWGSSASTIASSIE